MDAVDPQANVLGSRKTCCRSDSTPSVLMDQQRIAVYPNTVGPAQQPSVV